MPSHVSTICALVCAATVVLASASPAYADTWSEEAPSGAPHSHSWFVENGYPVPPADFPLQMVLIGEPPEGLSIEEVERAARHTAEVWSSVPCSFARLEYAGMRESPEDLRSGEYPFIFADPNENGCLPDDVIAWTRHQACDSFPTETVFLNTAGFRWGSQPQPFQPAVLGSETETLRVDLASVLTHEFGHVLGLAHSFDSLATMAPTYKPDGSQKRLAIDDKLGLCSLYEVARADDECQSGRDCGPTESCEPLDGLWMCHEFRGELGDACARDRLVCTDACIFPQEGERWGYCTVECGPGAGPCPDNFACVENLVRDGERHCQRLHRPEEPACASGGSSGRVGMSLWGLAFLMGVGLVRRNCWATRVSSSR